MWLKAFSILTNLSFLLGLSFVHFLPEHALAVYVLNFIFMYKILLAFYVFLMLIGIAVLGAWTPEMYDKHRNDFKEIIKNGIYNKFYTTFQCVSLVFLGILGVDWFAWTLILLGLLLRSLFKSLVSDIYAKEGSPNR